MIKKIKRFYRFLFRNPPKFHTTIDIKSEKHGSDYGGWTIVKNSLDINSTVLSFGIGNDITFDESIISKYKCKVHGFDPTPRVLEWIKEQNISEYFIFHPIGIASNDDMVTFYEPTNPDYISHSAIDLGNTKPLKVPCNTLKTIIQDLQISNIDVLKMDIEGFEYEVIPDIIKSNIRPMQLLVEFHHMFPAYGNTPTENTIKLLEANDYRLFHVSDTFTEFSFLNIRV
jgi:FkbM family methyltransferase